MGEGGGGKAKKKKWSKGKVRDKLNNLVLFDKPTMEKLMKEVPSYKLITPSVVSERLKIRGSLARFALKELEEQGRIKRKSSTRATPSREKSSRRSRTTTEGREREKEPLLSSFPSISDDKSEV